MICNLGVMQKHLENQIRTNQIRTERSKQLIFLVQSHMTHPNKSTNLHSSLHSGHPAVAAALRECPLPRVWDAGEVTSSRKPVSRELCFAVCLNRWLHQQARLVAHLFCVLIFFTVCRRLSRTQSPATPCPRKHGRCSGGIVMAPQMGKKINTHKRCATRQAWR